MATTIDLDPVLEKLIEREAQRQGVSKSEFVRSALERVLGMKNPYTVLMQVRDTAAFDESGLVTYDSENVSQKVKEKLLAEHHR